MPSIKLRIKNTLHSSLYTLHSSFRTHHSPGFTLIELLVAISIISVAFGVIITSSARIQKNARDAQRQSDLRVIQSALQQYFADKGFFPEAINLATVTDIDDCTSLSSCSVSRTYLKDVPKDPNPTASYCYESKISINNLVNCNNDPTNSSDNCFYYILGANLESKTPGGATCQTYNYKLNPINSKDF